MSAQTEYAEELPQSDFDLAQYDDDYAAAPLEEKQDFEAVPNGKYQVTIEKVEMASCKAESKTPGAPMLKWRLKILGPKCANRILWRNNILSTKENLKWLKADLFACGMVLLKVSDLPGRLGELLDVKLEVTVKANGQNVNVYIDKLIVGYESGDPGPGDEDAMGAF